MTRSASRRGAAVPFVLVTLVSLAATLAGCGASQPSSAVLQDTAAPGTSVAAPSSPAATSEPSSVASPATGPSEPPASHAASGPPPKPGNVTFKKIDTKPGSTAGTFTETYRITWTSPKGAADSFLAYGMADCLRYSKRYDGKPCVVRGMPIDPDSLTLLGVAPGSERSMTVSWDVGEVSVPAYWTILIRATNDAGNSIFTIVKSYDVCWGCVY